MNTPQTHARARPQRVLPRTTTKQTELTPDDLQEFKTEVQAVATLLADFKKPLTLLIPKRQVNVDAFFSSVWKKAKDKVLPEHVEAAKRALRSQGCSEYFTAVVEKIISSRLSCSPEKKRELLTRFLLAIKFAVHLSPDKGAAIYRGYDEVFRPSAVPEDGMMLTLATTYKKIHRRA